MATELKTLEDIDSEDNCGYSTSHIRRDTLRKEAKKYLQDFEEHIARTYPGENLSLSEGEMAREVMRKIQTFIKHFFNLKDVLEVKDDGL